MVEPIANSSASEEARLELAVAAAAAERGNRPRWIIALGVVLLIATTIYTLVQVTSRTAELLKVKSARESTEKVESLKAQLDRESAKLTARGTNPNPRMGADIELYATGAGIILAQPVTDSRAAPLTSIGMQQITYRARAVNQDPVSILNWLRNSQDASDRTGLEILEIKLSPGGGTSTNTPGWNVDVQFSRWEKTR